MLDGILTRAPAILATALVLFVMAVVQADTAEPSAGTPGTVKPGGTESETGALVSLAELCAFRAPLALNGDAELPAACAPVVDWLRRLRDEDPPCFERWLAESAVPDCALPHR